MDHYTRVAHAVAAGQPIPEQEEPQPFKNETHIFSYQNWQQELEDLQKKIEQEEEQQRPQPQLQLLPLFHSPASTETSTLTFTHPPFHIRTPPPPFSIPSWTPPWLVQSPPPVEADISRTHQVGLGLGADLTDPSTDTPNPTPPTTPQESDTETLDPHPALSSLPHPPSPIAESPTKSHPSQGSPWSNTEAEFHRLRNVLRHLEDRFHLLSAELQNLERRRVEMERYVREYVERGGFVGFEEGDWEWREEELETGFEEREGRLTEGHEEMRA